MSFQCLCASSRNTHKHTTAPACACGRNRVAAQVADVAAASFSPSLPVFLCIIEEEGEEGGQEAMVVCVCVCVYCYTAVCFCLWCMWTISVAHRLLQRRTTLVTRRAW